MTVKVYKSVNEQYIFECDDKDFIEKYDAMRIYRFNVFNTMMVITIWARELNKECEFVIG